MDNQTQKATDTTADETKTIIVNNNESANEVSENDNAGPSSVNELPGSVPTVHKTGVSKSEHNIRQIVTVKDVSNALKSISFNPNADSRANNEILSKDDPATFVDLKNFMASCFKGISENVVVADIPNVHAVTRIQNDTQVLAPLNNNDARTNEIIPNEVIVTAKTENKLSKLGTDKKKTSGGLSERSDLVLAQRDSISSIGSNVCRICMTRGRERLISPCNCKGSLANVHLTCLERWLNQVGRNHCELCGFSYPAIRTPRYTVLQALRLWFGNPRNRSHLQSDCLIFWLLSTVTAGLLAVCIVGTQYFVIEGNKFGISHRITETAMDFFMAIVLCGYSVTVYLLWKDHYIMWNRWRRANVNVRLLLTPDSNPVPFVPRNRYIV
uniref:RING-CH-type domain-containing protein n=1 Tax=Bombyx mori TaxID=7091 RepID=A0A8R2M974_BOMMO|nr:E3 ubiquitin-protein ligase MARCHF8 isoform X2 [Bombyx mori]